MSKSVYVMDMPKNGCMDCDICRSSLFKTICGITGNGVSGNHERGGFPNDCPLKPMPDKMEPELFSVSPLVKEYFTEYNRGWNACIDAICGEEKVIEIEKATQRPQTAEE